MTGRWRRYWFCLWLDLHPGKGDLWFAGHGMRASAQRPTVRVHNWPFLDRGGALRSWKTLRGLAIDAFERLTKSATVLTMDRPWCGFTGCWVAAAGGGNRSSVQSGEQDSKPDAGDTPAEAWAGQKAHRRPKPRLPLTHLLCDRSGHRGVASFSVLQHCHRALPLQGLGAAQSAQRLSRASPRLGAGPAQCRAATFFANDVHCMHATTRRSGGDPTQLELCAAQSQHGGYLVPFKVGSRFGEEIVRFAFAFRTWLAHEDGMGP